MSYYCSAGDWGTLNELFAEKLSLNVYGYFLSDYGGSNNGPTNACGYIVLNHPQQTRPAAIAESAFTCSQAGYELCYPGFYDAEDKEAEGIFWALCEHFVLFDCFIPIGTTFDATGFPGFVRLTWQDNDEGTWYDIYRSDSCWGPYGGAPIATVEWHPGGQYTYDDHSVQYSRNYYYRVIVSTGEKVEDSAQPTALPLPTLPGTPPNLVATGTYVGGLKGTVHLDWNASSGSVTGYHVYRSSTLPLPACTAAHDYLGNTAATEFNDPNAIIGITYYYRVAAYNASGHSGVSNEVNYTFPRTMWVLTRLDLRYRTNWMSP